MLDLIIIGTGTALIYGLTYLFTLKTEKKWKKHLK